MGWQSEGGDAWALLCCAADGSAARAGSNGGPDKQNWQTIGVGAGMVGICHVNGIEQRIVVALASAGDLHTPRLCRPRRLDRTRKGRARPGHAHSASWHERQNSWAHSLDSLVEQARAVKAQSVEFQRRSDCAVADWRNAEGSSQTPSRSMAFLTASSGVRAISTRALRCAARGRPSGAGASARFEQRAVWLRCCVTPCGSSTYIHKHMYASPSTQTIPCLPLWRVSGHKQ